MNRLLIRSLAFFLFAGLLTSQNTLDKTRQEIKRLEKEIREKQASERSLMDQIEDVNREIGLRKKLILNLEAEKNTKERDILNTRTRLQQALEDDGRLKALIGKRMISMYKRGRQSEWEMLLSLSSVNQMLVWLRYQKIIIENDRRNLKLLQLKQETIRTEAAQLQQDLEAKQIVIRSTSDEAATLENRRNSRQTLLSAVRNDATSLRQQLEDRRKAYNQIAQRIQQEQAQTKPRVPGRSVPGDGKPFSRQKGKLDWPAAGKIISKYGVRKNPILKTETFNQGIEIETIPNAAVSPLSLGVVKWVTWQRGMGHLVLIDHGGDFYTVYGYLEMVLVDAGTEVDSKTIIGNVGDSDSLYGSTLHFEIWQGTQHQNPELWLR